MTLLPTHWIVGLDLESSSRGALLFADWLARNVSSGRTPAFTVVHVMDEDLFMDRLRFESRDDLVEQQRAEAFALLDRLGVSDTLGSARLVAGWKTVDELEEELSHTAAEGLMAGRHAESEGFHLVHLGKVARHLLHRIPAPVMIVPPDLEASAIGSGPLLVFEDQPAETESACRTALELGELLGRQVELLRLVTPQGAVESDGGMSRTFVDPRLEEKESMADEMKSWLRGRALGACGVRVVFGMMPGAVQELADELDALMLLAGSKPLTLLDRVLGSHPAVELAATSGRPLLAVPPES